MWNFWNFVNIVTKETITFIILYVQIQFENLYKSYKIFIYI